LYLIYHNDDRGPPHSSLGASAPAAAASYDINICITSTPRPNLLNAGAYFVHCLIYSARLWFGGADAHWGARSGGVDEISGVYTASMGWI